MLAELMRFRQGIAVAGTHGKTTTTSLVASVLAEGGLDPTFVIGGRLKSAGSNARLGTGRYLVAEADESDGSFLHLQPVIAIVTNIDNEHLAPRRRLREAEAELRRVPAQPAVLRPRGAVQRRRGGARLLPQVGRPTVRYGLGEDADLRAVGARARGRADAIPGAARGHAQPLAVTLNLPGLHNVRNALAAIAVATELEVGDAAIQRALAGFEGIGRRLELVGDVATAAGRITSSTTTAITRPRSRRRSRRARQAWPDRRLVLAFQPHRYTRTRDLIDDFGRVLSDADALLVTEVYAAGEEPIANADGRAICRAVRGRGRLEPVFVEDVRELPAALAGVIADGDVVLTMGAGSIGAVAHELPAAARRDEREGRA